MKTPWSRVRTTSRPGALALAAVVGLFATAACSKQSTGDSHPEPHAAPPTASSSAATPGAEGGAPEDQEAVETSSSDDDRAQAPAWTPTADWQAAIIADASGRYRIQLDDLPENALSSPGALGGARLVPTVKDGEFIGFKVYAIQAGSLWVALGVENGDTLTSINDHALTPDNSAGVIYEDFTRATEDGGVLTLVYTRKGQPATATYEIVPRTSAE